MQSWTIRIAVMAALSLAFGLPAMAQAPDSVYQVDPRRPNRAAPPAQRQVYRGYYPGMLVQPAPSPPPQQGFSLRRLFGIQDPPAIPPAMMDPQAPVPRIRVPRPKPPPVTVARPEKPKVDPSTFVVVFGDALADSMGQGLENDFEDTDIAVVRKIRADSGLARSEGDDWPTFIKEILMKGQKVNIAVVMLGANDRQPIQDAAGAAQEFMTERWRMLYRERADEVAKTFQEKGIPFIFVGVPPMKNADVIALNDLYRESAERFGGTYVDIWRGFVDEENRYISTGPDVEGQTARLRTADGNLFTRAGGRKAAHFVDTEIKRIIEARKAGGAFATVPDESVASPDEPDDADSSGIALPAKPAIGPILPLTKPNLSPGGALMTRSPRLNKSGDATVQKVLREGVTPPAPAGRADDFRWPGS